MLRLRYITPIILILSGWMDIQAQNSVLLLDEFFETAITSFNLNQDLDSTNTSSGVNEWIVNSDYNGRGKYPNTISQDSTISGTITNAPFSGHLHIHNSADTVFNANFDPTAASSTYAISDEFCTLGYEDVKFRFFWLCQGGPNNYGEVYYSNDDSSWHKVGLNQYNNQSKWLFEEIQDTAFEDKESVRFAFRWVNDGTGGTQNASFAVDDIFLVGTAQPVTLTIDSFLNDSICQIDLSNSNFITFRYNLSNEICSSQWQIEISNASGVFANPPVTLGTFTINYPFFGTLRSANLNGTSNGQLLPTGNGYRIRIRRISPSPQLVSTTSPPFTIYQCPNTIRFVTTPEVFDNPNDAACIGDDIDVRFISDGIFNNGNWYYGILSDSNGNFANADTFGRMFDNQAFRNFPWGRITGKIPNVPPGCGYYLNIISSSPGTNGQITNNINGPFCILECQGGGSGGGGGGLIQDTGAIGPYCIPELTALRDTHYLDLAAVGFPLSQWTSEDYTIQIVDRDNFNIIEYAGGNAIRVEFDTINNFIIYHFDPASVLRDTIAGGDYFAKIIIHGGPNAGAEMSVWFRLSFSYPPSLDPPVIYPLDSVYCNNGLVSIRIADSSWNGPPGGSSTYQWLSPNLNNGNVLDWEFQTISINFAGSGIIGFFNIRAREVTPHCPNTGPFSAPIDIPIIGPPSSDVSGDRAICFGDTSEFAMEYLLETTYNWDLLNEGLGEYIVENNNDNIKVLFDTVGTFTYTVEALNKCGSSNPDTFRLSVKPPLEISILPVDSVCEGEMAYMEADVPLLNKDDTGLVQNEDTMKGIMFDIEVKEDFQLDSLTLNFFGTGAASVELLRREGGHVGFENDPFAWESIIVRSKQAGASGLQTISWNFGILFEAGKRYGIYITVLGDPNTLWHAAGPNFTTDSAITDNGVMTVYEGSLNSLKFNTLGPGHAFNGIFHYRSIGSVVYDWQPIGADTRIVEFVPDSTMEVSLYAYDPEQCGARDTTTVEVNPNPEITVMDNLDTCSDQQISLNATASLGSVRWEDLDGNLISNSEISDPITVQEREQRFLFFAEDVSTGCIASDTVLINGLDCSSPIKVPNAFAPNGNTPENQFFSIFLDKTGLQTIEVHVFNRWGERVYYTDSPSDVGDFMTGWDGRHYESGTEQPMGVYVYYIKATFNYDDKVVEKKGNLTLLR